jgi:hypothetical protein
MCKKLFIVAALAIVAVILCRPVGRADEVGSDGKPLNGMAPVYAAFPSAPGRRSVSADVTLPRVATNKQWYGNWVMIVGTARGAQHQAFVQVGVIRRPGVANGDVRAFVAWQGPDDRTITYHEYDAPSEAVFRLRIEEQPGATFVCTIDGRKLGEAVMIPFATAYAQVGPEVYAEGDTLSGSVAQIAVSSGGDSRFVHGSQACRYTNHGVSLVPNGSHYDAAGSFDRRKPSAFVGDCSGI